MVTRLLVCLFYDLYNIDISREIHVEDACNWTEQFSHERVRGFRRVQMSVPILLRLNEGLLLCVITKFCSYVTATQLLLTVRTLM